MNHQREAIVLSDSKMASINKMYNNSAAWTTKYSANCEVIFFYFTVSNMLGEEKRVLLDFEHIFHLDAINNINDSVIMI